MTKIAIFVTQTYLLICENKGQACCIRSQFDLASRGVWKKTDIITTALNKVNSKIMIITSTGKYLFVVYLPSLCY